MEENKEPQAQQPNPIPVMDIQPPRNVQDEQSTPDTQTPSGAPEQSTTSIPVNDAAPQTVSSAGDGIPAAEESQAPVLAAVATKHKSHRAPILAIVCAVLVAGVFAAVSVMVYLSGSDSQKATDSSQQTTTTTEQEDPATAEDVSETEKAVDESLSGVDDASDYSDTDVSDTTLGL